MVVERLRRNVKNGIVPRKKGEEGLQGNRSCPLTTVMAMTGVEKNGAPLSHTPLPVSAADLVDCSVTV
jgi:hypothetical protein